MSTADTVLKALRLHVEHPCGPADQWGMVYLDNARPVGMSVHSFRSALAALSARGDYVVEDGYAWGRVRLAA